ncbi:MAG: glutamine amidotransferase [Planctomycetota bacterium]
MELQFYPIWPWPFVLALGLGLILFSHWTYRKGTPGRRLFLALRWVVILLTLLVTLRPNLVFTRKHKQSSTLVLLVDKSKSMLLRDMWDDQSRWDALSRMWKESADSLTELGEEVQIREYHFDQSLHEGGALATPPDGDQTALGAALEQILERSSGERLAGILLFSDGTNTSGTSPLSVARQIGSQKVPIYAFGFGRETASDQVRDIAARAILTNATTFAKNKLTVRGEFQASGYANQAINVRLLFDGAEKARGVLNLSSDAGRGMIELAGVPEVPGEVKITLEAQTQPGELLPGNNQASTFVTVLAGGLSVLEIEGKYRYWEPKFLRWALDQSPDIELSQLFLLDNAGREETIPPEVFAPGRFDVIILGDVNSNRFKPEQLKTLAELVSKGTGLLMMGGYESFGPGGWGNTPLADVLPVVMRPADRQKTEALKMQPTAAGLRHFILRLAPNEEANAAVWKELRPLDGGSSFTGLKPNALPLAASADGTPLLVAEDVGAGRSLAFVGDTTWRWRKDEKGILAHARFWRQLILWLAHKEDATGNEIRVRLPSRRLASGQKLPVEVEVIGEGGKNLSDGNVQAVVATPSGTEVPFRCFSTERPIEPRISKPRARRLHPSRGRHQGLDRSRDKSVQVLGAHGGSGDAAACRRSLTLRSLATTTGGEFHTPEELPRFLESLKKRDLNLEVSQPIREPLWDRASVLFLFVALLSAEWFLRKRKGLA